MVVNLVDYGPRYFSWRSTTVAVTVAVVMRDGRGCGCQTAWRLSTLHAAAAAAEMLTSRQQRQPRSSTSPHTVVTSRRFLTSLSHSQVRVAQCVWSQVALCLHLCRYSPSAFAFIISNYRRHHHHHHHHLFLLLYRVSGFFVNWPIFQLTSINTLKRFLVFKVCTEYIKGFEETMMRCMNWYHSIKWLVSRNVS